MTADMGLGPGCGGEREAWRQGGVDWRQCCSKPCAASQRDCPIAEAMATGDCVFCMLCAFLGSPYFLQWVCIT